MPPRYHFDLQHGRETLHDEQGVIAETLDQAIEQAIQCANEMRINGELPASASDWSLLICDEAGTELRRIQL